MDKLTPNEKKIIKTLQELKNDVCSKDLSQLSEIHPNSIGRYLKKLTEKGLIEINDKQIHNKRFKMICISKAGKKLDITIVKVEKKVKAKVESKPQEQVSNTSEVEKRFIKLDLKSELRIMILNLVVRKVDYKPLGYKNPAEYKNKVIELIELL